MKKTDIQKAYEILAVKSRDYDLLTRYYEGDQPVVHLTTRLQTVFSGVKAVLTENWCSVVVDSCLDRIKLNSFTLLEAEAQVQNRLEEVIEENQLMLEAEDLHEAALVTGEAFMIAEKSVDDDSELTEVFLNNSGSVHCFYEEANPRKLSFAVKGFNASDGTARMILYYRDHFEYYLAPKPWKELSSHRSFRPDPEFFDFATETWPANPYSRIPVFHFKTSRKPRSELTNAIPPQNGINKLLSDMMVAAEYGAFRQRWVISSEEIQGKLRSAPGETWDLPAGDGEGQQTQVGEFETTDLDNYLKAISNLASSTGMITRTPRHYFFQQGGDPSGEALIAMEAPLNKKVQDRIDRFIPIWKELIKFIIELEFDQEIDVSLISVNYSKPESVLPKTTADITKVRIDSGIPLETALLWEGKSQAEVDAVMKLVEKRDKQTSKNLAEALKAQEKARSAEEQPGSELDNNTEDSTAQTEENPGSTTQE